MLSGSEASKARSRSVWWLRCFAPAQHDIRACFHNLLQDNPAMASLLVFDEGDQPTHFGAGLAWIHQVCQDVAVPGIDAAGSGPGVEGDIITLAGRDIQGVALDWLRQWMPVFCDYIEGVAVQVHGVAHHGVRAVDAHMNRLPVFHDDWLRIRETLAVNHVVALPATDELGILDIGVDGLLCLWRAGARVDDEGSVEAAGQLLRVIIVAVVPVRADILI